MCLLGSDDVESPVTVFEEKSEVSEVNVNGVLFIPSEGEVPPAPLVFKAAACGKNNEVPYFLFVNPDPTDCEMMPLWSDSEDEYMDDQAVEGVLFVFFGQSLYSHSHLKLIPTLQKS
jgi:hypothetical protein